MGYQTSVHGSLKVEPRLTDKEIEKFDLDGDINDRLLVGHQRGEDDTVGVVDGQITVIPGKSYTEITCAWDEPFKAYDLPEVFATTVQKILKAGHTITGALYLEGEESGDFSRLRVDDDKAVHEHPVFLWPNGDKGLG